MSSGLTNSDSLFSIRVRPWHGLGAVLEQPPHSVQEALTLAGLDWQVNQLDLYTQELDPVPGLRANVRSDTGQILGVVSTRYTVVQNVQALEFLDNLIGSAMHFETAGSLWAGRRVWALAKLPEWIRVGGDQVERFCLVSTSHDGTQGIRAAVTPVRVVCNNTLTWALKSAPRVYAVRHRGALSGRLHEARQVLDLTVSYYDQFKALGDRLAGERMSELQLRRVLDELYPTDVEGRVGARAARNAIRAREQITELFLRGDTVGNAPHSKWCAVNAICEHLDYNRPVRGERFARIVDEQGNPKNRALQLVAAL